jgi:hypothetical protein
MEWYKYAYGCYPHAYSGRGGLQAMLDSLFKPQYRDPVDRDLLTPESKYVYDQEKVYMRYVYAFHVALVAPLLLYLGWNLVQKRSLSDTVGVVCLVFGLLALVYHGTRFFVPRQRCRLQTS